MDFGITTQEREELFCISKAKWATEGVKYLGIHIYQDLSMMARQNLAPLINNIKNAQLSVSIVI